MSRSIVRHIARAAVVTTAVLTAGLAGMSTAHADPPSQDSTVAVVPPDLAIAGGIDAFSLGEVGGAAVTADVANFHGPSAATTVRFTLVRVARITMNGRTQYVNLLNSPTVRVTGDVPAIRSGRTAEVFALVPQAQYRPGLTRITACVDPDRTAGDYSYSNNCGSEIRTI